MTGFATSDREFQRARSISRYCSLIVAAIGAWVLVGWLLHIRFLISIAPDLPSMKANTALSLLLAGSALSGWHQQQQSAPRRRSIGLHPYIWVAIGGLLTIATLTLVEFSFNLNLGIGQSLLPQPEPSGSEALPGQMAPNTAISLFSAGISLLCLNLRRPRIRLAQGCALIVWLLSLVGLVGLIYNHVGFYTLGSPSGMALHTAIALQLLSVGLLCAVPHQGWMPLVTSNRVGSLMLRRLLPLAIGLPLLLGSLNVLSHHQQSDHHHHIDVALHNVLDILIFAGLICWNARSLNRLDWQRQEAEQQLYQTNLQLEQQVTARTLDLQRREHELRAIFEAEPEGIWITTVAGQLTLSNPAGLTMLEVDNLEALPAADLLPLIHPADREPWLAFIRQVAGGESGVFGLQLIGQQGTRRWVEAHAVPLRLPDGPHPLILAIVHDVTERRQADLALRESEAKLHLLIQHAPASIAMFDRQMRYIAASQRWLADYQVAALETIAGQTYYELMPTLPNHWRLVHQRCLAGAVERGENHLWLWADGRQQWLDWEMRPWYTATGAIGGIIIFTVDVTQRYQVQQHLQQVNQDLEQQVVDHTQDLVVSYHRLQQELLHRQQVEFQLQQSVMFQNAVLNSTRYSIISTTIDGIISSFNHGAEVMLGYAASGVVGQTTPVLIHDREEVVTRAAQLSQELGRSIEPGFEVFVAKARQGEAEEREWTYIRQDGSRLPVRLSVTALYDEQGAIGGFVGIASDITERKRMEAALRTSEDQFRHAFEDASIGMAIVSLTGQWLQINAAVCQIVGYPADELLQLTFQDITHPDDLATDLDYVRQLIEGEIPTYQMEKRYVHQQGHIVWVLLNVSLVRDPQEQPLHFIAQIQDISDRKHYDLERQAIEAQLRQSQAALLEAQQVAHLGNWELDLATGQITWSAETFHLFGLNPTQPAPHYQDLFDHIHPDDRQLLQTSITQTSTDGTPFTIDLRFYHTDGSIRSIESKGKPVHNDQGNIVRLFGTALDITDRKRVEAALRLSEATNRALISAIPDLLIRIQGDGTYLDFLANSDINFIDPRRVNQQLTIYDVLPYDQAKERLDYIQQVLQTQESFTYEYELIVNNQTLYEEARIIPVKENEVLVVIRDIRDRKLAEAALRLSEERLQLALEASGDGLWDWNVKTGETYCSPHYITMLGYSPTELELTFETWQDLVHPDDLPWVLELLTTHLQDGTQSYAYDYRLRTRSGEWKWVATYGKVVWRDEQGQPLRMIGTHRDITNRKQAEFLLQETATRNSATTHILQQMRQTLDLQTIFATTTQELRHTLQCDRVLIYRFNPDWSGVVVAEAVGEGWVSAIAALTTPAVAVPRLDHDQCIVQQWDSQSPKTHDTAVQTTQGGIFTEGQPYLTVSDIEATDFDPCYREFLQQLQVRAYVTVPIFSNHKLWGLLASYANAQPRTWRDSEVQIASQISTQLGIAIAQAELFTQVQQQSQELKRAKEAAEVANQSKSIFLANMSHELRTPLNVILGFTQLLRRDTTLSIKQQDTIQMVHRSGEHLLSLINDVLDLSKIEADRTALVEERFNPFVLLQTVQTMMHQPAVAKNLQLQVTIAPGVPQFITADAQKLRQILLNLLSNAIKFTDYGRVTLHVELTPGTGDRPVPPATATAPAPTHTLNFVITDTGVGIAATQMESIFEAFTQADAERLTSGGTGLGLTISRRFARIMGGDITVTSQLGQGSTFRLALPVTPGATDTKPLVAARRQFVGLAPNQPSYRILVVDDDPNNRLLLSALMAQLGMEVQTVNNGQEAVERWQQWQPHLIWMDLRMPELTGYEATERIRQQEFSTTEHTIIIALTAQSLLRDRTLALSAGCDDFVTKPFDENWLFDKMAQYLNLQIIYSTDAALPSPPPALTASEPFSPGQLATMPTAWLAALYNAAQVCDEEAIEQLLQKIPAAQAPLAHHLKQLAHDYQFGQIKRLLRGYQQERHADE